MSRKATIQSLINAAQSPVQPAARRLWPISGFRRLWQDWSNRRHLALSIKRLDSLSPHLLEDIGLGTSVADIGAEIRTVPTKLSRPTVAPAKIAVSAALKLA